MSVRHCFFCLLVNNTSKITDIIFMKCCTKCGARFLTIDYTFFSVVIRIFESIKEMCAYAIRLLCIRFLSIYFWSSWEHRVFWTNDHEHCPKLSAQNSHHKLSFVLLLSFVNSWNLKYLWRIYCMFYFMFLRFSEQRTDLYCPCAQPTCKIYTFFGTYYDIHAVINDACVRFFLNG